MWGLWWGGLCFYAAIVVPIGTQEIGALGQGFITQQVTQWHNGLSSVFIIMLFVEAARKRSRALWVLVSLAAVLNVALIAWHYQLTSMMDFQCIRCPTGFYAAHALYLWLTAAEWMIGLLIPICLFRQVVRQEL